MRPTCVHSDTTEYCISCWVFIVNDSEWFFFHWSGGNSEDQFCFLSSLQIFSFLSTFVDGWRAAIHALKKTSVSCMLTRLLMFLRAQTDGQLSNSCSSSVFLALTSENVVVTESSFKNVISWATWKASCHSGRISIKSYAESENGSRSSCRYNPLLEREIKISS